MSFIFLDLIGIDSSKDIDLSSDGAPESSPIGGRPRGGAPIGGGPHAEAPIGGGGPYAEAPISGGPLTTYEDGINGF